MYKVFFLGLMSMGLALGLAWTRRPVPPIEFLSPIGNYSPPRVVTGGLGAVVTKSLEGTTGTYSVAIKNFKTGESFFQNQDQVFLSGSLYKLWVMAVVEEGIALGTIDPSEKISESIAEINAWAGLGPEDAELLSGTVNFTVEQAVEQMITISHNYAALSLVKKIGAEKIRNFLELEGLNNSLIKSPPQTTADDTLLFLEKLYRRNLVRSEEMIQLMMGQQLNEGLPKYLPKGTKIAHKTGEVYAVKHGAGLVFSSKGDYAIVAMSESDSPFGAEDRIALLSRDVYNYFQK